MMLLVEERDLLGLPPADRAQLEIAEVDVQMHALYGRDEAAWLPAQVAAYLAAVAAVLTDYTEGGRRA
ncbi:hypothetical protein [Streptomyces boncukensis]|uniref:Uncharacterized protein n=1 Tax=Streptomyces boncukensis TaxID=2711219 RepID=A0A6G4WVB2_9ACTN|nr:hypothetical protein [Streptomyces boncukensis]NGO69165.1 hypothetical protein [Streptomyces boncukensis]